PRVMVAAMQPPLSERLRAAFQAFKEVAAARARLEVETEARFHERTAALEAEHREQLAHITNTYQDGLAAAEEEANEARTNALVLFDGEFSKATQEMEKAKRSALRRYAETKDRIQGDFQESRWTVTTVYDAGRKNSKDQLTAAQDRAQLSGEQLIARQNEALQ